MVYTRIFLIVSALDFVLCAITYILFPAFKDSLTEEDFLIENISALLFLSAFVLALIFLRDRKSKKEIITLIIIAVVSLICFADEISFGERLFDLPMPELYGVKIDGFHDFALLGRDILKEELHLTRSAMICIAAGSAAVLSTALLRHKKRVVAACVKLKRYPPYLLITLSFCSILAAIIIDLDLFQRNIFYLFEELLEMNAALALALSALCVNKCKN